MATAWRQGDLIAPGDLHKLGLIEAEDPEVRAIVISHSCDIAQGTRPEEIARNVPIDPVEVLIGRKTNNRNGSLRGHSTRKLQVEADAASGMAKDCIELFILQRKELAKARLLECKPWADWSLSAKERRLLALWLAQRYSRAAFPDEVVRALKNSGIEDKLMKTAEEHGDALVGFYFDVPDADPATGAIACPIKVNILLAYDADDTRSKAKAEAAAGELARAFEKHEAAAGNNGPELELGSCEAISDRAMTLAQARKLRRWRFEYLSLDGQPIDDSE